MPPLLDTALPLIKGWCPTAYRPMESGDGLIIRAHTPRACLTLAQLRATARIARAYGNGLIDLTQRAQIQIRGLSPKTYAAALPELAAADLLAPDTRSERRPHVIAWPLAALTSCGGVSVETFASALAASVAEVDALLELPPKFLFVVEGGDGATMPELGADIRFTPTIDGQIEIRLGGAAGYAARVQHHAAIDAGCRLALAFLKYYRTDANAPRRMKHLVESLGAERIFGLASLTPIITPPAEVRVGGLCFYGLVESRGVTLAGVGAPSGRLSADVVAALANCAEIAGANEALLTPWRLVLFRVRDTASAAALLETACALGLIVRHEDPRRAGIACPGAPECSQARGETRVHLEKFSEIVASFAGADGVGLHISGCKKGCARPGPAPVTLVATDEGYDLIENGRASDLPKRRGLAIDEVESALVALAEDRQSCPTP